jgi:hypothetical protein
MFSVGDMVRFTGEFRDEHRQLYDPGSVVATVTHAGGADTYMMGSGVSRADLGHYHVDVRLDFPGSVHVRFASTANGQESHSHVTHQVGLDYGAHEEPAHGIRVDALASPREMMISDLRSAGVEVEDSRSDAFITAAHDQLVQSRADRVRAKLAHANQARPWLRR